MNDTIFLNSLSTSYLEALYIKYQSDPSSFDDEWHHFFEQAFEKNSGNDLNKSISSAKASWKMPLSGHNNVDPSNKGLADGDVDKSEKVQQLIERLSRKESKGIGIAKLIKAYRERGHLVANINPILPIDSKDKTLQLEYFGLEESDREKLFKAGSEVNLGQASLSNILAHLKNIYCSTIGYEFVYCSNAMVRQWLYSEIESKEGSDVYSRAEKQHIYKKIVQAHYFEQFLQRNYVGQKRFSLEGLESLIPSFDKLVYKGAELGVKELVVGMAHRGRLNVLVNIFGKTIEDLLSEFEGGTLPDGTIGDGDVKYHLGQSVDIETPDGKSLHLSMAFNPSHLEAINPIVQGIVYAKSEKYYKGEKSSILPVLIHGDSAVAGQGIVYECNNMSNIVGYDNGGILHIVLNNQIGFTAEPNETRSSLYCTDIAKVSGSPVFHVNADDPIAVVYCMELAIKFRQYFGRDVWIDIIGYRRHGHNESDEPRFTQPKLYKIIDNHQNVKDIFSHKLLEKNTITEQEASTIDNDYKNILKDKFTLLKSKVNKHINIDYLHRHWVGLRLANPEDFEVSIETGCDRKKLDKIAQALVTVPDDFNIFRKVKKVVKHRREYYFEHGMVDWALAELLAYGSLLLESCSVRLSGQDCKRGTFSHRHASFQEVNTGRSYVSLNHIDKNQRKIHVYNSPLSEYGVLGFEYGYSLARPKALTIWEAQFGDFVNGAQIIVDQFISTAESKWLRLSGLVLLLPHGYEGQGPEHSSARIERFLTLCAENNIYVANPTTSANFFHLIRRQILNPFRKPLIVFTPKSLLRNPKNNSTIDELVNSKFREVIDDDSISNKDVDKIVRLLFCSGKIYYELDAYRETNGLKEVAIVRIEQLYPFCHKQLEMVLTRYKNVKEWFWIQEEPINMGAWPYILRVFNKDAPLKCIARIESMSTATGIYKVHLQNQKRIIESSFENLK